MSDTLYESFYNASHNSGQKAWGVNWIAQTFKPDTQHRITSVKLKLYQDVNPQAGDLISVSIRATDGSGHPTGADLTSAETVDIDDLPAYSGTSSVINGYAFTEFTFADTAILSADTTYAIVIRIPDAGASNEGVFLSGRSLDEYSDGNRETSSDSGSSWSATIGDTYFYEYGLGAAPPSTDKFVNKYLVAVGSREVWYESTPGTMSQIAASISSLDTTTFLDMFEIYGKAMIVNKDVMKVVDLTNVKIHTTSLLAGDTYPIHGTVLTATAGSASGASMVVDYITALTGDTYIYGKRITDATFESGDVCTGIVEIDGVDTSVSFTLDAAEVSPPHYYNWTSYGDSSTYFGSLPDKATIGCNYMGRAVVAGDEDNPHQWYMSRQENVWDFLYGINDALSAVAGNNADAGEVGDVIRALIPYKDDYLIFGCENSIWYLIGNPCDGGSIEPFSLSTGIYGAKSWCFDNNSTLYFWGKNGIYRAVIPGQLPQCISEIKLPDLVNDEAADPSTHRITFAFDNKRNGIVISITQLADGTNSNYFYDLRSVDDNGMGGFFPEEYPEECSVFSAFYYEAADPDYRKLILGCNDGYLRFFDETSLDDVLTDDTVEAINSYVSFGPIPMSKNPKMWGKLIGLFCVAAGGASGGSESDSDNISYKIFTAVSAEEAIEKLSANSSPVITGTITAPGRRRGSTLRKCARGIYMGVRLSNSTEGETWALEQLFYDTKEVGRFK